MIIQQVSVFLENQPGTLIGVLAVLKENGVNIRALSLADTADFGILRLIVDDPQALEEILRKAGLTAKLTSVLAVTVKDRPGDLAEQIEKLAEAFINIEYMYAFAAVNDKDAHVALKVDDVVKAEQILG
ncbi:ACT domain-containing protein [Propionispora hippei]|uniref:Uncharacterized conserved protein, contains tandem ACT domains n=1 Tax=Propionispora hippei DSM 15287 TaxID=1123003 RepID=A0A1M6LNQ6_9FIRM|nr:ACT domain-containing protein [Propionispora hippei]SHJ72818.1 Uncharacterized conserved protein, contains tandem ACT domains [Propionispora hippei DSM 15287]